MIDLSPEAVTFLMMGGILLGVMTGFPLAFVVGSAMPGTSAVETSCPPE